MDRRKQSYNRTKKVTKYVSKSSSEENAAMSNDYDVIITDVIEYDVIITNDIDYDAIITNVIDYDVIITNALTPNVIIRKAL